MNIKDRLMNELIEISDRILKLVRFNKSEEFNRLSNEMRNLLIIQQSAMTTYVSVLQARIELLEKEGK